MKQRNKQKQDKGNKKIMKLRRTRKTRTHKTRKQENGYIKHGNKETGKQENWEV